MLCDTHRREAIAAGGAREKAEGEQQRHRPKARHEQIDIAGTGVFGIAMMGHDQRPGGERHGLPGQKKGEGIGCQHHQGHGGEEHRKEGQHAVRRCLVAAMAKPIEARRGAPEIDHHEEKRGKHVDAKIGTDPRNAERQCEKLIASACKKPERGRHECDH